MIIFKSENKFFDKEGRKLLEFRMTLDYFLKLWETDICFYEETEFYKKQERSLYDKQKVIIDNFISSQRLLLDLLMLDKETEEILFTLKILKLIQYVDIEKHGIVNNKEKLTFKTDIKDKNPKWLEELTETEIYLDMGIKVERKYYSLNANRIALDIFGMPSSRNIISENLIQLFSERQSEILKEKINFLNQIEVEKKENEDRLIIKSINGKKTDMNLEIENLNNTNLKVGRIDRINLAAVIGKATINEKSSRGYKLSFKEDNNAEEALVIIPIENYAKKYLIDKFNLKYFGFAKNCIVGITDKIYVSSLFN